MRIGSWRVWAKIGLSDSRKINPEFVMHSLMLSELSNATSDLSFLFMTYRQALTKHVARVFYLSESSVHDLRQAKIPMSLG